LVGRASARPQTLPCAESNWGNDRQVARREPHPNHDAVIALCAVGVPRLQWKQDRSCSAPNQCSPKGERVNPMSEDFLKVLSRHLTSEQLAALGPVAQELDELAVQLATILGRPALKQELLAQVEASVLAS